MSEADLSGSPEDSTPLATAGDTTSAPAASASAARRLADDERDTVLPARAGLVDERVRIVAEERARMVVGDPRFAQEALLHFGALGDFRQHDFQGVLGKAGKGKADRAVLFAYVSR